MRKTSFATTCRVSDTGDRLGEGTFHIKTDRQMIDFAAILKASRIA